MTPKEQAMHLASFELVWSTVRDHNPDPKLNGLDWQAIHDRSEPRIERAKSAAEVRAVLARDDRQAGRFALCHHSPAIFMRYRR
jgi:hypothetical protein